MKKGVGDFMSFLEYLGLESLLDDTGGGFIGVGIMGLGIIGWLLLAIIKPSVIDQAAMVFNLLAFIILLLITLKKMKDALKEKELNKNFVVISIIAIIISFIFGLTIKYHSIIYNYEYNHICSGIALTFIPTVIINLLYPFFYNEKYTEKQNIITRIKCSFGAIGLTILIIIACFLFGQAINVPVALLGKEEIYNNFTAYHNISFNQKRKEIKDKKVDEYLQETYYEVKRVFNERCINDNNQNCDKFIKDNYVRWLNEYTNKEYGYKLFESKSLNDTEEIIRIVDREYGNEYYNYKLNMNDFSLTKISDEEFLELLNN